MGNKDIDIHPHLKARMLERGVTLDEIMVTFKKGHDGKDAKSGTYSKVYIFPYNKEWCGKLYKEKEVTIYYKQDKNGIIVLTVKARYGIFLKRSE